MLNIACYIRILWRMRAFFPTQIKIFLILLIITEMNFKHFETFNLKINLNNFVLFYYYLQFDQRLHNYIKHNSYG
jgi:hypothetical protein